MTHHKKHHEMKHHEHHEYKPKSGFIDNRMERDSHQEGIARVLQRKSECNPKDYEGHHGKMGMGGKAHWSRKGDGMTPRKA